MGYLHYSQDCQDYHDRVVDWGGDPPRGIITLCGSTKFKDHFMSEMKRLTLEGFIVIPVGLFGHSGDLPPEQVVIGNEVKDLLDLLHFRKIDLADRVHIIDPGGYIGDSTTNEIAYATMHGKVITYLSSEDWDD